MCRIAVVGSSGAGKTTFARELGRRTGIAVVNLDEFYWRPGWRRPDRQCWRRRQEEVLAGESWIADGNYWSTLDIRLSRADTVIVLDRPRWVCLLRVLRRNCWHHGKSVQAAGCPERVSWDFLHYLWSFPRQHRPLLFTEIDRHIPDHVILLRSNRDEQRFLAAV
ncbi:adenylate kinase family enzyme [Actinopolyspora lacussalsi]|nr:adenylate kinase family enzyme [Actinopolyspora lacussalsi]